MQEVLRNVQVVVFVAVALVAAYQWWRRRTESAAWMTATLGILGYVVVAGRLAPEQGAAADVVQRLNVAILALFPFALYRFMRSFLPPTRILPVLAAITTAATVGWSLFVDLPEAGEPRAAATQAFVVLFMLHWTVLSAAAAVRLWRSGRGQPAIARARMRLMGAGAIAMNVALLLAAFAGDAGPAVASTTALLALLSAVGFYLGFAPPAPLRRLWRREAERVVRDIQLRLVASARPEDVGAALAPFVDRVLGGHGIVLADADGEIVASHGVSGDDARHIVAQVGDDAGSSENLLVVPMRSGTLVVEASPFTPYFGDEELGLLEGLAAYVDLALERTELAEREREAREDLARANEELEGLVFGISHDLKSPIITLLGFVDLLRSGHADQLDADAHHYLKRMSASALYMQDLLNDLLELSRIGRVHTEVEPVDLGRLVDDVAEHVVSLHPDLTVETGDLPTVMMSAGRARQLFTNLVENAAKHGGRDDITVRIDATEAADDGAVEIRVSDDGQGIPAEYREKVFGIFERLADGGVSSHGTGIGLTICRKIVEEIGGEIELVDGAGGANFRITLPEEALAPDAPLAPNASNTSNAPNTPDASNGSHRSMEARR